MTTSTVDPSVLLSFRSSLRACTSCDLHLGCSSPVPFYGPLSPDICIVGEAPGRTEDREGRPFVGSAGAKLSQLLKEGGINPSQVAFTNAVQCFPGRGLEARGDRHYIDTCRSWMRGQVAFIQPRFVITVGVIPFLSVRRTNHPALRELHGKPLKWPDPPAPANPIAVWPTYHPSAALRSKKYKDMIVEDLRKFVKWVDGGCDWPTADCYLCGDETYNFDDWQIPYCERHSAFQGLLFPEDQ